MMSIRIAITKKNETLRAEEDLYRYLMLLERDAVDAALFVRDTELFRDPIAAELLAALGVETEQCTAETKLILIRHGGESAAVLDRLPQPGETLETAAGTLGGGEDLALDGVCLASPAEGDDLCVSVLRGGEQIDCARFRYTFDASRGVVSQYGVSR